MFTALLENPPRFFKIGLAESPLTFAAIVAWIVKGREFLMKIFIHFDFSCFQVFF